jgi:Na+-transporting methylmalonyl-CoA/oxaloacetate decarboxylase gamma subunit
MDLNFSTSKPLQYFSYLLLFITGQSFSMWGQYVTLPYKHLTYWQGFSMAIKYAWIDWFFMTFAIDIGHRYNLVTPTQNTFLLIILQFSLVLLINQFYLKQKVYRSDIVAFVLLLIGYIISFFNVVSKMLGISIPKKLETASVDESKPPNKTSKKVKRIHTINLKHKDKQNNKKNKNINKNINDSNQDSNLNTDVNN